MIVGQEATARTLPWLSVTLAGLVVALYAAFGPAPEAWVYDRAAIAGGEWWRLISGHWVHSDRAHLVWNLAGLLALGWIVEMRGRRGLLTGLLVGTLGVDLVLWLGLPGLAAYCGLSGVLNSLLPLALAGLWQRATAPALVATGALSLLKITSEISAGQALFTHTAWASVPEAHLAGWLAGLIFGVSEFRVRVKTPFIHQAGLEKTSCEVFTLTRNSYAAAAHATPGRSARRSVVRDRSVRGASVRLAALRCSTSHPDSRPSSRVR
jgi:rhomboid family GlyGly-CTERM serine protease